jgi:cell division protein FtsQ
MAERELFSLEGKVLPFRRPSSAVRVRRRNPWLALAGPFTRALVLVATPIVFAAWLLASPTFALSRFEISGNHHVERAWVESALAPLRGENLWRLPLESVEQRLRAHPWIAGLTVEKRPPNGLRLVVSERQPAALLRTGDGLMVLDRAGSPIAPWLPGEDDAGLLLVSVGAASAVDLGGAVTVADELREVAPDWAATLSEVEVLSEEDFRLYLGALPFPLVVRAGTLAARLAILRPLVPELARRYVGVSEVDLRFERRLIFQPIGERS